MAKRNLIILFFILFVITIACGTATPTASSSSEENSGAQVSSPSSPQASADSLEPTIMPTVTPDPNIVEAGVHLVGKEIKPGIYVGHSDSCYWERLKDLSGSFDAIIANGNSYGQFYVQVKESDFAFSSSCDVALLDSVQKQSTNYHQTLEPGVFLVGADIKPGIYKGEEEGCYWERLRDVTGGFDAIIANGNSNGQFYVQVKENDFAFSSSCGVVLLDPIPEHSGEYPKTLEPGLYLVGPDIQPGTYKGVEEECYWERLKDVAGDFSSIISNDISNGQFFVQVSKTDFALSTSCKIERVGD